MLLAMIARPIFQPGGDAARASEVLAGVSRSPPPPPSQTEIKQVVKNDLEIRDELWIVRRIYAACQLARRNPTKFHLRDGITRDRSIAGDRAAV